MPETPDVPGPRISDGTLPADPSTCEPADRHAGPDNVTQLRPPWVSPPPGTLPLHEAAVALAWVRKHHALVYDEAVAYAAAYVRGD